MKRPNSFLVILTALWRLGIAITAFAGWWLYGHDPAELPFLTQSGNLLVALVYLGLVLHYPIASFATGREPGEGKTRGAMTLLLMVVGCTFVGVMGGDTSEPKDLLTHVVTPVLVFIDWCLVGRSQNRARWWHPFLWIIIPAVWLIGYTLTDGYGWVRGRSPLYGFLDPGDDSYGLVVLGLVVASIAGAYLLYGIAKLKNLLSKAIFGSPQSPVQQPQVQPWPAQRWQPVNGQSAPAWHQQPVPYSQPQQGYAQPPPPAPAPYGQYPGPYPQQPGSAQQPPPAPTWP